MQIDRIPDGLGGDFDWYGDAVKGIATRLVNSQDSDGHWIANSVWAGPPLSTAWAILILVAQVVEPGPVADAGPDKPGSAPVIDLKFDASGSYHQDPNKTIIEYAWDFDASDGIDWDHPDLVSSDPIVWHAFPAVYNPDSSINWPATIRDYTVTLRVKDNSMPDPKYDVDTCLVNIVGPPWEPIAEANGPYWQLKNQIVTLDGSGSRDPNSEILPPDHPWYSQLVSWEWDLDNDGQYDDASGPIVQHTWTEDGIYVVGLRVTNTADHTDTDDAVVVIGNRAPVAEADGPYSCFGGAEVSFDGSGSSDPDGDPLQYRWDFDSDGVWDTDWSADPTATHTYPGVTTYLASLQVKDTSGATNIDTANVLPERIGVTKTWQLFVAPYVPGAIYFASWSPDQIIWNDVLLVEGTPGVWTADTLFTPSTTIYYKFYGKKDTTVFWQSRVFGPETLEENTTNEWWYNQPRTTGYWKNWGNHFTNLTAIVGEVNSDANGFSIVFRADGDTGYYQLTVGKSGSKGTIPGVAGYLQEETAVQMYKALRAQLLAVELSTAASQTGATTCDGTIVGLAPDATVYLSKASGFPGYADPAINPWFGMTTRTVAEIIQDVENAASGNWSGWTRAKQEFAKNILEAINKYGSGQPGDIGILEP